MNQGTSEAEVTNRQMRYQLFRTQASRKMDGAGRIATSWRLQDASDVFLSEEEFARVLSLERKRAERSHKFLLLMLLDASGMASSPAAVKTFLGIISAVSASTRETDVKGWHKAGSVVGIIFTEIASGEKESVRDAVHCRTIEHLERRLAPEQVAAITISSIFLPEDWLGKYGDSSHGANRYPDLFHSNERAVGRVVKRMIDLAGAGVALVALSPLYAALALLVKLTSHGPVLFRQKRVGQWGKPFECVKFRSMYSSNDSRIHQEYVRRFIAGKGHGTAERSSDGAVYKLRSDPRVTPFGRFLRRTSLDELPQFWNVLKGEMSLVGPRPAILYELECYDVWHRRRVLELKPGITGLWQVRGRSRTTFDEMVRLDLKYARTWSLWLDLKIILQTPKAVVSGEGAY